MVADAVDTSRDKPTPASDVQVIDSPLTRVRRFTDVLEMLATAVGIVLVLLISAYAVKTAEGITEDIQGISPVLQRLLIAPVNIFSGIVTLVVPAVVIATTFVRREPRRVLESIGAALIGIVLIAAALVLIHNYGAEPLVTSLSVPIDGELTVQVPAYLAAVGALLTAAGRRNARRSVRVSWTILWIAVAVAVISGIVTATAAILTILIGRLAGLATRWAVGSTADRAYGDALVEAIVKAGFKPRRVVRADTTHNYTPEGMDDVTSALAHSRQGRVYSVTTTKNHHLFAVALDGDQQAAGFLTKLWSTLRLRGISTRADVSLRHSAQSTALLAHAARTAGVRTPRMLGMAESRDTFVLVYQRPVGIRPLTEFEPADITDAMLDAIWAELLKAHDANIAHRSITAECVFLTTDDPEEPHAWLTAWELGEVAASELAVRIDRAQLVTLLATKVGAERAVESAFRALSADDVEHFAPMLQTIAMPRSTREALKDSRPVKVLETVREKILERLPDATVEAENITRFGTRTVVTLMIALVATAVVVVGFRTQDYLDALEQANPWWLLIAVGWVALTYVGASLTLIAFSPVKLPWGRVMLVQMAAAYVALAAPAGVGPAALNARMLTRRNVPGPLAVATVALIQVSAVVVTVAGLLTLTLLTGSEGTLASIPSTAILIAIGVSIVVIALALLVPRVRRWAAARVLPTLRQTWPRLSQIISQPSRLGLGLAGNAILTIGYVGAFHASLAAFGQNVPLLELAVVFFVGNTVGALVPTPGGLFAVEIALSTALQGVGLSQAVALSAVIVYRFITYWLRIPLGFASMRYLERKGEL